jgi:hypothetical protein
VSAQTADVGLGVRGARQLAYGSFEDGKRVGQAGAAAQQNGCGCARGRTEAQAGLPAGGSMKSVWLERDEAEAVSRAGGLLDEDAVGQQGVEVRR